LLARANRVPVAIATTTVWLNGAPAGRIEIDGELSAVSLAVENGRVTRVYLIRNPEKLTRLDHPAELALSTSDSNLPTGAGTDAVE
jgi:hypothetical protein